MRIRSTRVVVGPSVIPATVVFDGPTITAIETHGPADVDYGELVIMPGLIDAHVHVNEPGRTEWEGFASATAAASPLSGSESSGSSRPTAVANAKADAE